MKMIPFHAGIAAFTLVLCVLVTPVLADNPGLLWQKSLGGSADDNAINIQPTADGGYLVVGTTESNNGDVTKAHGLTDVWVVKVNATGAISWQKDIGGSMDDVITCIEPLSDGTFLLSGYTWSHNGDFADNQKPYSVFNIQIDTSGNILWKRCYPGKSSSFVNDEKETPDGGMVMIGQSYTDPAFPEYHGGYDVLVVKSSINGTIVWEKLLGGSGDDFGDNILPVADGGYIGIGYTNSNDGDVSGNHGSYDAWLFRLDGSGNLLWQRCLGGSLFDEGREIVIAPGGEYAVIGSTNSKDGDVRGNHGSFDYWWLKVSPNGSIINSKCFGGTEYDNAYDLELTPDGNYMAFGLSNSKDGDVTGNHGNSDYWVMEFDQKGLALWQKSFGGPDFDIGECIKPDLLRNGRFSLTGYSYSNGGDVTGNHGLADFWVVHMQVPIGLQADFTVEPLAGTAPLTVKCTDKSTGNPTLYNYDFGDGVKISKPNPSHTYQFPGKYTIKLTVTKYDRTTHSYVVSRTKSQPITVLAVPFVPPVAKFVVSPVNGTVPLTVTVTDQSSGKPSYYNYDFGDGTKRIGPNQSHTYQFPGKYTIKLTVAKYDKTNHSYVVSRAKSQPITVLAVSFSPLVAKFIASPVNGTVPLTVTFSDQSIGYPSVYKYNFGDEINTTGPNPVHIYRNPGNYTVTLAVIKKDAANGTLLSNITIQKDLIIAWDK
ncbi:MAG: PKD domain-containing protein [Methanomicrobiales archaeon]|nr:PKD domain-containing protein [Methanomicrobiales archaeon]